MGKLKIKKSLLLILTIFSFDLLYAQKLELQSISSGKYQFGFNFNKVFYSTDVNMSTFSGVYQLFWNVPVSSGLNIIGNIPYITTSYHIDFVYFGDYEFSENGFGNIFLGLQTNGKPEDSKRSIYSFGLYLPTASDRAAINGYLADYYYFTKYLRNTLGIYFNYAFHKIEEEGFNYGFEIGPDLIIPIGDNNSDVELMVHYGILGSFVINKFILNMEFLGIATLTSDVNDFGDRFVNMINIGVQWKESLVTPVIYFKIYLRDDINRSIDGVLGIGVNISID